MVGVSRTSHHYILGLDKHDTLVAGKVTMRDKQTELPYAASVSRETVADTTSARVDTHTYRLVSHRWELVRDASFPSLTQFARVPEDAARILLDRIGSEPQEHFAVLALSTRNQILAVDVIAVGTVNACIMTPADVYRRVLAHADAAACIVGHNHPSGVVAPSQADHALTKRLKSAGKVLGIDMMDHVVVSSVAGACWWSFQDHGEL